MVANLLLSVLLQDSLLVAITLLRGYIRVTTTGSILNIYIRLTITGSKLITHSLHQSYHDWL